MGDWDRLERHFDGLTAEEVDQGLAADVPAPGATPVSAASVEYLAEHGGPDLDREPGEPGTMRQRRALRAARTLSETLGSALTLDEAAEKLGISRSRISHRLSDGSVWAITVSNQRHLPKWQFTPEGRTIPGLQKIVPAIPQNLHPLAIESFMSTPRPDFDDRSPVEWLASGGNPAPVAEWLAGMAHG